MQSPSPDSTVVLIPARLNSTRLPRKMLLRETGKTLVRHTYEGAAAAKCTSRVIVATDCEEIAAEVRGFGGEAMMTSPVCASGTDRVAEVAAELPDAEIFVNVQGDEPEIVGEAVDACAAALAADGASVMSTLAVPIRDEEQLRAPSCVKVICDAAGRAIYFSRGMIPFAREWDNALLSAEPPVYLQHMGIYAYRREFLLRFPTLPRSPWEQIENLEQLRVLHAGGKIAVGVVGTASVGIDTPEDYQAFVRRWKATQNAVTDASRDAA